MTKEYNEDLHGNGGRHDYSISSRKQLDRICYGEPTFPFDPDKTLRTNAYWWID